MEDSCEDVQDPNVKQAKHDWTEIGKMSATVPRYSRAAQMLKLPYDKLVISPDTNFHINNRNFVTIDFSNSMPYGSENHDDCSEVQFLRRFILRTEDA